MNILNKRNKYTVLGLYLAFGIVANGAEVPKSNIFEQIDKAIQYYPSISSAQSKYEMEKFEVQSTKAQNLPQITFSGDMGREYTNSPSTRTANSSVKKLTRSSSTLKLSQHIYDFGGLESKIKEALANEKVSSITLKNHTEELIYLVITKYINLQKYRALLKNSKLNLQEHQRITNLVQQRVEKKVDSRSSSNLVNGRLVLAELSVKRYEQMVKSAEAELMKLTGEIPQELEAIPQDLITIQEQYSLDNHSVLAFYKAKIDSAKASIQSQESELYPTLAFEVEGGYHDDIDGTEGWEKDSKMIFTLNYTLYDGGARKAQLNKKHQFLNTTLKDYEEQLFNVKTSLDVAYSSLKIVQHELKFFRSNRDDIEKAKIAYNSQYKVGKRTLFDLLNIQSEYFNATESLTNAMYDEKQKKIDIKFEAAVLKDDISSRDNNS